MFAAQFTGIEMSIDSDTHLTFSMTAFDSDDPLFGPLCALKVTLKGIKLLLYQKYKVKKVKK